MKNLLILIFAWILLWQPAVKMTAQKIKQNPDVKEKEKETLIKAVDKSQDSTLELLDKKKQPVKKKPKGRVDTLLVKGTTIVTPVETLPDTYYLVQDSTIVAKKKITLWQKIFGKRKRNQ